MKMNIVYLEDEMHYNSYNKVCSLSINDMVFLTEQQKLYANCIDKICDKTQQPSKNRRSKKRKQSNKHCNICGKNYASVISYRQHMKTYHDNLKGLDKFCESDLVFKRMLNPSTKSYWHKNAFIFNEFQKNLEDEVINQEYTCRICLKYFVNSAKYREHEEIHYINNDYIKQKCISLQNNITIANIKVDDGFSEIKSIKHEEIHNTSNDCVNQEFISLQNNVVADTKDNVTSSGIKSRDHEKIHNTSNDCVSQESISLQNKIVVVDTQDNVTFSEIKSRDHEEINNTSNDCVSQEFISLRNNIVVADTQYDVSFSGIKSRDHEEINNTHNNCVSQEFISFQNNVVADSQDDDFLETKFREHEEIHFINDSYDSQEFISFQSNIAVAGAQCNDDFSRTKSISFPPINSFKKLNVQKTDIQVNSKFKKIKPKVISQIAKNSQNHNVLLYSNVAPYRFYCEYCEKICKRLDHLEHHEWYWKSDESLDFKMFVCKVCKDKFFDEKEIDLHHAEHIRTIIF